MFNIFKKKPQLKGKVLNTEALPVYVPEKPKPIAPSDANPMRRFERDYHSLREHVATAILAAIVSRYGSDDKYTEPNAKRAVKYADALIKELKSRKTHDAPLT